MIVETPEGKGKDANIGLAPPQASTELGARSGILGIIDGMPGITQDDFNEDYAERVVEKVATAIRLFYTPLQGEDQVARFCQKVHLVAADKVLQKSVEYMTRIFPNLIQYQRDPSHAVRLPFLRLASSQSLRNCCEQKDSMPYSTCCSSINVMRCARTNASLIYGLTNFFHNCCLRFRLK